MSSGWRASDEVPPLRTHELRMVYHLAAVAKKPLHSFKPAVQVAICVEAEALTDSLCEGGILLADKVYDTPSAPRRPERKARVSIAPKANQKGTLAFWRRRYRQRNLSAALQ